MNNCMAYWPLEMIGAPDFMDVRFPQHRRDWKKSQKKIRRERRRRMAYRKGKVGEMKAIELVFRAQPIVAALREIARQVDGTGNHPAIVADCDEWLDAARELLKKKGDRR